MKKIIIGVVSAVIIVSGIICFSCIKKQNVEKNQSTNLSSIEKKKNEAKNENEQKVEEKSTNSSEDDNKQKEANKENTNKETTKKQVEANNSTKQETKSNLNNSTSSVSNNKNVNDSQNNQSSSTNVSQSENKNNSQTTEVGPVQNIVNDNNSQITDESHRIDYYRENGIIKEFTIWEECKSKSVDVAFETDATTMCYEAYTNSSGQKVYRIQLNY